jgi:hypothetical protein
MLRHCCPYFYSSQGCMLKVKTTGPVLPLATLYLYSINSEGWGSWEIRQCLEFQKWDICIFFKSIKVPKCENFDGSDFHDFYTMKHFWVGNFGEKIKTCYFNFWGSQPSSFNCWCVCSLLTLSVHIISWRLRSAHTSVPYAHAQHVLKGHFQIWNFGIGWLLS